VYTFAVDQSLFVHLRQHRRFPENVVRIFAAELLTVLEYLHERHLSFPKLEPENIFLDEDGTRVGVQRACLPVARDGLMLGRWLFYHHRTCVRQRFLPVSTSAVPAPGFSYTGIQVS